MSLSFIAGTSIDNAGISSLIISKPSGTTTGDYMLAFISRGSLTVTSVPAGWTLEYTSGSAPPNLSMYSKICGAAEPSNWSWSLSSNTICTGIVLTYRSSTNAPILIDQGTWTNASTDTDLIIPSVTVTTSGIRLAIGIMNSAGDSFNAPLGFIERRSIGGARGLYVFDLTPSTSGASGTIDMAFAAGGTSISVTGIQMNIYEVPIAPGDTLFFSNNF